MSDRSPDEPRRATIVPVLTLCLCLALPALVAGQAASPLMLRPELARLDALLAAGDTAGAEALLQGLDAELERDDRLAFDAIYVLVGHRRYVEARAQWNRLAPRVQQSLRAASEAGKAPGAGGQQERLAEVLFMQALLVARGGDTREALDLLRQTDGLGFPALDSPLMLLAAECLFDLREYDLAVAAYGEYVKRHPSDAKARAGLGAALYSTGKVREAREELEAALRADPATPRANYTLAAVLFEMQRFEDARQRLERELALDPRCTPCLSRLAHIAYLAGDDRQCESWLVRAMALDPADLESQLVSGLLALRDRRYDVAIVHLVRAVEQSPDFPTARYQLAIAYQRAGQADKAREHLEAYRRLLKEQSAREIGVRGVK
jgi:tetratricopeptide (TPR) repeat protein